jgi:hypothetical protein
MSSSSVLQSDDSSCERWQRIHHHQRPFLIRLFYPTNENLLTK